MDWSDRGNHDTQWGRQKGTWTKKWWWNGFIVDKYEIASYSKFCLNLRIYGLLETSLMINRRQHPPSHLSSVMCLINLVLLCSSLLIKQAKSENLCQLNIWFWTSTLTDSVTLPIWHTLYPPERNDRGRGLGRVSFTLVFFCKCGPALCVDIAHPISTFRDWPQWKQTLDILVLSMPKSWSSIDLALCFLTFVQGSCFLNVILALALAL